MYIIERYEAMRSPNAQLFGESSLGGGVVWQGPRVIGNQVNLPYDYVKSSGYAQANLAGLHRQTVPAPGLPPCSLHRAMSSRRPRR